MDSRGKNQSFSVVGFQYEPENPDNQKNSAEYDDDDSGSDDIEAVAIDKSRLSQDVQDWCSCGHCQVMPTEKECVCCTEIDAIKYFHLQGELVFTIRRYLYFMCF